MFTVCLQVSVSHSLPDITHPSFGDYSRGGAAGVEENGILQADSGLDVRGDDDIIQVFSPDMNKSCNECHARIGGTEECVVCRVEVSVCVCVHACVRACVCVYTGL